MTIAKTFFRTLFAAAIVGALALSLQHAIVDAPVPAGQTTDLAKKLWNLIARLISVPTRLDHDIGIGVANAERHARIVKMGIPNSLPTMVVRRQESGWNSGLLANHVRLVGGHSSRADLTDSFWTGRFDRSCLGEERYHGKEEV